MRHFYKVVIGLSLIYFLGGWVLVHYGQFQEATYFTYSGIVGSFASIAALLSLTRPAITQSDIQSIEVGTLKSLAETTEQLKALEGRHAQAREAIDSLEITKQEMALLVKKASLALFLKEQYSYQESQVLDEISKNSRLNEALKLADDTSKKLHALDEEIATSPYVIQLREIISSANRRKLSDDEFIDALPPLVKVIVTFSRVLSDALIFRIK
ncbi:hypothetical protein [Methylotenera mobilis]|uniref:hypothetical protein n=1 Tax=Methylotenera mobilis TaxID=359408 RepID=UPI0003639C8C|nr:hypothetical protein [Methylotenera mobilis]